MANGQTNAKFQEKSMDLVACLDPLAHQRLAYTVQRRQALLRFSFRCHEAHRWTACRLADGFGIDEVVLVALDEGTDELRGDQFHLMAIASQQPGHVMGAGAGFHHDHTSVKCSEEFDQLLAAEFLAQQCFALAILAMHMKAVLAEVDADERNVLHDGLRPK
jgi:hypothetical protein